MSLDAFFASIPLTVGRAEPAFRRVAHALPSPAPVLAAYRTASDLLADVGDGSTREITHRQALVHALLDVHRARPHDLWPSLLAASCKRMLEAFHARLRGDREERGQRVLLAFFQAIELTKPRGQPLVPALRWATGRALFPEAGRKRVRVKLEPFDETAPPVAPSPHLDGTPYLRCLLGEIAGIAARLEGEPR